MMALNVIQPGLMTTVQDFGRAGMRRYGVPLCGALDSGWLRLANALVGNAEETAGLEIHLTGPILEAEADGIRVAVVGPALVLAGPQGEQQPVAAWRSITLKRGDRIQVKSVTEGTVAYLAVAGGFDLPEVLGSRSTYVRARMGGLDGRPLAAGDRLVMASSAPASGLDLTMSAPPVDVDAPIRVVLGPQADHFTDDALRALENETFHVGNETDRMGMRLSGPVLRHQSKDRAEIISEGVVPGVIQVPGNGQPILLLADSQTVGGYPKIATVISADLARVARSAPGAEIRFRAVTVEVAEDAAREVERDLRSRIAAVRPLAQGYDVALLYQGNLIGGVVDCKNPDNFPGHLETHLEEPSGGMRR
ncbi:MAG: biotin-dependent carboxyltransferase family protein [Rhodospirillales bacterium]|nr:biotin-dependent carboxyltransferase family protein [Rhodospirillales bacterium]